MDGVLHLSIGRRSPDLDRLLASLGAREAVLITAANPASRPRPPGWNARMNRALAERLAAFPCRAAEGRLGPWREPGFLACGPSPRLARLGRRFRQNALVRLRAGRAPALLPLV